MVASDRDKSMKGPLNTWLSFGFRNKFSCFLFRCVSVCRQVSVGAAPACVPVETFIATGAKKCTDLTAIIFRCARKSRRFRKEVY